MSPRPARGRDLSSRGRGVAARQFWQGGITRPVAAIRRASFEDRSLRWHSLAAAHRRHFVAGLGDELVGRAFGPRLRPRFEIHRRACSAAAWLSSAQRSAILCSTGGWAEQGRFAYETCRLNFASAAVNSLRFDGCDSCCEALVSETRFGSVSLQAVGTRTGRVRGLVRSRARLEEPRRRPPQQKNPRDRR